MGSMKDLLGDDLFSSPPPTEERSLVDGVPAEVCALFEKLALQVAASGRKRFSSDMILHRIRWHYQVEQRVGDFKCNDHWTAPLARWFLSRHPELPGFFETRRSPHGGDDED